MTNLGCGPTTNVDGPPPFPPRYGLLKAAEAQVDGVRFVPNEPGAPRWLNGVAMWTTPASAGEIFTPFYDGTGDNSKSDGEEHDIPEFWPVTVLVPDTCSAFVVGDSDQEYRARIFLKLAAVESSIVARALMTGEGAPVASVRMNDGGGSFPNADTALSLPQALAALEGAIAATGRGGVIHMSPMAAVLLSASGHIIRPDPLNTRGQDVLRSVIGTLIVPDSGYAAGADPDGHAAAGATQEWMYATGPIDIRRDDGAVMPPTIAEALDRGTGATRGLANSITYRAERDYLVAWDNTLQAAVLANRT